MSDSRRIKMKALVEDVSKRTGMSKKTVGPIVSSTIESIGMFLYMGDEVYLKNLCTLYLEKLKDGIFTLPNKQTIYVRNRYKPKARFTASFISAIKKRKIGSSPRYNELGEDDV